MLVLTLRFLATGMSFRSLQFSFRLGVSTVSKIVRDTCSAIVLVLKDNVLFPETKEEWLEISEDFENKWNFPNVLGCVDGKHIKLRKPANSGSQFFNYKGTFSTVLMAVCDANYRFIYYDVGNYGHHHDSHVFKNSSLGQGLENNEYDFPEDRSFTARGIPIPYFFLGDGGFPLGKRMMKPYAGSVDQQYTIFNYRLSRARRVIENAFGVLSARWRILLKEIETSAALSDSIVSATIHLHNFLSDEEPFESSRNGNGIATEDTEMLSAPVASTKANNSTSRAKEIREELVHYFVNEGSVPWQNNLANSF